MEELQVLDDRLTVQQMAQVTGLSAHTLRYYERAGLLPDHVRRDGSNGYRYYTQQDVNWISFIKRLRSTDMPIREIRRYAELMLQGDESIPERIQLLKQHRRHVEEHLDEVEQHLRAISTKIDHYEQYIDGDNDCNVPYELKDLSCSC